MVEVVLPHHKILSSDKEVEPEDGVVGEDEILRFAHETDDLIRVGPEVLDVEDTICRTGTGLADHPFHPEGVVLQRVHRAGRYRGVYVA